MIVCRYLGRSLVFDVVDGKHRFKLTIEDSKDFSDCDNLISFVDTEFSQDVRLFVEKILRDENINTFGVQWRCEYIGVV